MKVKIITSSRAYEEMFTDRGWEIVYTIEEADLVQFTGGEDVSPVLYGEGMHHTTYSSAERDLYETRMYLKCLATNTPMTGICRGGQFLNVMNGGRLYQDVDGHAIFGSHPAITYPSGKVVLVTSTHHQMMRAGDDGEIMAYAQESSFRETDTVYDDRDDHEDTEVVLYRKNKVLCFQPHPEIDSARKECVDYYFELLEEILDGYDSKKA